MATINDLPKLEGIRDFFVGEIYGEVGDLLIDKGFFYDKQHPLFLESLSILDNARGLVDIVFDDKISPEKKDEIIEATIQNLYEKLAELKAVLRE